MKNIKKDITKIKKAAMVLMVAIILFAALMLVIGGGKTVYAKKRDKGNITANGEVTISQKRTLASSTSAQTTTLADTVEKLDFENVTLSGGAEVTKEKTLLIKNGSAEIKLSNQKQLKGMFFKTGAIINPQYIIVKISDVEGNYFSSSLDKFSLPASSEDNYPVYIGADFLSGEKSFVADKLEFSANIDGAELNIEKFYFEYSGDAAAVNVPNLSPASITELELDNIFTSETLSDIKDYNYAVFKVSENDLKTLKNSAGYELFYNADTADYPYKDTSGKVYLITDIQNIQAAANVTVFDNVLLAKDGGANLDNTEELSKRILKAIEVKTDKTPPTLDVNLNGEILWGSRIQVDAKVSDNVSQISEITIDTQVYVNGEKAEVFNNGFYITKNGEYTAVVSATDLSGNTTSVEKTLTFETDPTEILTGCGTTLNPSKTGALLAAGAAFILLAILLPIVNRNLDN